MGNNNSMGMDTQNVRFKVCKITRMILHLIFVSNSSHLLLIDKLFKLSLDTLSLQFLPKIHMLLYTSWQSGNHARGLDLQQALVTILTFCPLNSKVHTMHCTISKPTNINNGLGAFLPQTCKDITQENKVSMIFKKNSKEQNIPSLANTRI